MNESSVYFGLEEPVLERVGLRNPKQLRIASGNAISFGARQTWYPGWLQRMGGCGPTTASNLIWYLAATRPRTSGRLFDGDGTRRADMEQLMGSMYEYIRPGMRGVDKASTFVDGALRYATRRGVALDARVLEVPAEYNLRPDADRVQAFLAAAFADDLPVAFLNLSNGALSNLDAWHWVTLVAIDGNMLAEMYDQGHRQIIDIGLWLGSTSYGGAFIALEPTL